MSRQAQDYLSEHLPEIRRATYTDTTKKTGTRHIGENGLALLVYLCDHTNREGVFFMSARSMQEGADIATIREVRRLLAGFTELGWITPTGETVSYYGRGTPTPVYALTLLPGVVVNAKSDLSSVPGDTPKTTEKTTEPLTHKGENEKTDRKTEPEPEPQPEPERFTGVNLGGGENELTEKGGDLLTELLAQEDYTGVRNYQAVRAKKRRDYLPIVREWEQVQPPGNAVEWCRHKLLGTQPTTPQAVHEYNPPRWARKDDQQPCEHGCDGFGVFVYTLNGKEIGLSDCVCNGGDISKKEPTHLRVVS